MKHSPHPEQIWIEHLTMDVEISSKSVAVPHPAGTCSMPGIFPSKGKKIETE
jgi:hypothetical protein